MDNLNENEPENDLNVKRISLLVTIITAALIILFNVSLVLGMFLGEAIITTLIFHVLPLIVITKNDALKSHAVGKLKAHFKHPSCC